MAISEPLKNCLKMRVFRQSFFVKASESIASQLFFFGTLPPFSRALLRPMAIACFLLFTFAPLPLFSSPLFRSFIAFSTSFPAFSPYFGIFQQPPFLLRQKITGFQDTAKRY